MARQRKVDRKDRVPFGTMKSKLTLDAATKKRLEEAGKIPRWVNDSDGGIRLKNALAGGYEFVVSEGDEVVGTPNGTAGQEQGKNMSQYCGKDEKGNPQYTYLMAIDREFYEEDKAAKEAVNKKVDDAIKGGTLAGGGTEKIPGKGETYIKQADYRP